MRFIEIPNPAGTGTIKVSEARLADPAVAKHYGVTSQRPESQTEDPTQAEGERPESQTKPGPKRKAGPKA